MIVLLLLTTWPSPDELRALPDVADLTVRAADGPATCRLIRVADWHYLPKKRFLADTPDGDFDQFLDDVEELQAQQRALIKAIGAKSVFLEGLTNKSQIHFRKRIETLKKYEAPKGDSAIDLFVARLRREDLLQLGAPGAMLLAGELGEVLPADDAELHAAANPVKDGELVFDEAANKAREDGIAKLLLAHKQALVILGGEHNLTDNLPASVEYVRVTLKAYDKAGKR